MLGRAIACTVFIFALMIGSFFLLPAESHKPLTNVALTLVDVFGDGRNIKAGDISLPCLATRDDTIVDQYEMLKQKIKNFPGSTQYVNGIYVTLAADERRPVFQIRYPSPEYCTGFVEAYKACQTNQPPSPNPEEVVAATGACISEAAATLKVKENWSGMIETYSKNGG